MSSCLSTGVKGDSKERGDYKDTWENVWGDWEINYLNCSDNFKGKYICQNLSNAGFKYVQFKIHQSKS